MAQIRFTPIVPKFAKLIDPRRVKRELKNALDHTANIVRDDFGKTVRTWRNKPNFSKRGPRSVAQGFVVEVFTNHEVYSYVTRGTRAHLIRPRSAGGFLRFRTGFRPKTRVRVIGSRGGGAFGGFVTAKQVQHPGTQARDFDKEIAKRRTRNLTNLARLAILRAIRTR